MRVLSCILVQTISQSFNKWLLKVYRDSKDHADFRERLDGVNRVVY